MNTPNRFRFRAFDTKNKRMVEIKEAKSNTSLIAMCSFGNQVGFINADGSTFWSPFCVMMQSTGLSDKNGKEIFEGDIVSVDGFEPNRMLVEWVESAWCMTHPSLNMPIEFTFLEDSTGKQSVVVGNIHENYELLKGTNASIH